MGPDAFESIMPGLMNGYDLDLHMDLGDTPSLLTGSGAFDQMDDPRESSFGSPESQSTSTRETFTREDYEDFYELRVCRVLAFPNPHFPYRFVGRT